VYPQNLPVSLPSSLPSFPRLLSRVVSCSSGRERTTGTQTRPETRGRRVRGNRQYVDGTRGNEGGRRERSERTRGSHNVVFVAAMRFNRQPTASLSFPLSLSLSLSLSFSLSFCLSLCRPFPLRLNEPANRQMPPDRTAEHGGITPLVSADERPNHR